MVSIKETALMQQHQRHSRFGNAAALPMMVRIAQNEVINRELIDVLGYEPYAIGLARNKYERIEKALDFGAWVVLALALPIVSGSVINHFTRKSLLKAFPALPKTAEPLYLPFEALKRFNPATKIDPTLLAQSGVKTLEGLPVALRDKVLKAKMGILLQDMTIMAAKGQGFFIFRKIEVFMYPWQYTYCFIFMNVKNRHLFFLFWHRVLTCEIGSCKP
jgi:hypothetical protein